MEKKESLPLGLPLCFTISMDGTKILQGFFFRIGWCFMEISPDLACDSTEIFFLT